MKKESGITKEKYNGNKEYITCRVTLQEKGQYRITDPEGERQAKVSGKFRYEAVAVSDYPVVGDYVAVERESDGMSLIHAVLPRKSVFVRKAAGTGKRGDGKRQAVQEVFPCCTASAKHPPSMVYFFPEVAA